MAVLENMNEEYKEPYQNGYCFISRQNHKQDHQSEFPHYNARLVKGGIPTLALKQANRIFSPHLGIWGLVPFEIARKSIVELSRKMAHRGQPPHFDICSYNNSQHDLGSDKETIKIVQKIIAIPSNLDLKKKSNLFREYFSIEDTYLFQDLNTGNRKFTFRQHLGISRDETQLNTGILKMLVIGTVNCRQCGQGQNKSEKSLTSDKF